MSLGSNGSDHPDTGLRLSDAAQGLEPCYVSQPYVKMSEEMLTLVVDLYTEGKSLLAISKMEGMPSASSIYKQHRDNALFRERLQAARLTRALQLEEEILDLGDRAEGLEKDEVPGARLAFDIKNRMTEVHDPATYGKKQQISGDSQRPIVFQFLSHIPQREEKEVLPEELNEPAPE